VKELVDDEAKSKTDVPVPSTIHKPYFLLHKIKFIS
jgi:hypothetical protein